MSDAVGAITRPEPAAVDASHASAAMLERRQRGVHAAERTRTREAAAGVRESTPAATALSFQIETRIGSACK